MGEITTMTSKGQVTIPKTIRDALNLKAGDKLSFVVAGREILVVPRNRAVQSLFGRLSDYARPQTTIADYDAAIAHAIAEHVVPAKADGQDAA